MIINVDKNILDSRHLTKYNYVYSFSSRNLITYHKTITENIFHKQNYIKYEICKNVVQAFIFIK